MIHVSFVVSLFFPSLSIHLNSVRISMVSRAAPDVRRYSHCQISEHELESIQTFILFDYANHLPQILPVERAIYFNVFNPQFQRGSWGEVGCLFD